MAALNLVPPAVLEGTCKAALTPSQPASKPLSSLLTLSFFLSSFSLLFHLEIHRRQQMCKAEYGNWWDRLHSTVSMQYNTKYIDIPSVSQPCGTSSVLI